VLKLVKPGIATKAEALAHEALLAAKEIMADPQRVRGGPWLRETLTRDEQFELRLVSNCSSISQFEGLLSVLGEGSKLGEHLGDVTFGSTKKKLPDPANNAKARGQAQLGATKSKSKMEAKKPKAKAKASAKAKAAAKPRSTEPVIRRRRSGTPSSEHGHDYRVKKGWGGDDEEFKKHKFGEKGPQAARHDWWENFKPKRTMKSMKAKKAMKAMK
jgi:hypothetical protein